MGEKGLVSIVIPFYNAEQYIAQCLENAINQSYPHIEIICIDDGSTDNGYKIAEEIARNNMRIKVIHQNNQYAGIARNRGIDESKGKYITFWDADDIVSTQYIEKMLRVAESNRADIVVCDCDGLDEETGIRHNCLVQLMKEEFRPKKGTFNRDDIPEKIFQISNCWVWDKLYNTKFIKENKIRFQGTRVLNDGYFCCKASALASTISVCNEKLVIHRTSVKGSLESSSAKHWRCAYDMLFEVRSELKLNGLYEKLERSYINLAANIISYYFADNNDKECFMEAYEDYHNVKKCPFGFTNYDDLFFYNEDICKIVKWYEEKDMFSFLHKRAKLLRNANERLNLYLVCTENMYQNAKRICDKKYWNLPLDTFAPGSKVIIYGFGDVGRDFYRQLLERNDIEIVCIVDQKPSQGKLKHMIVSSLTSISNMLFDYIIISILDRDVVENVKKDLIDCGIPKRKIIWHNCGVDKEEL